MKYLRITEQKNLFDLGEIRFRKVKNTCFAHSVLKNCFNLGDYLTYGRLTLAELTVFSFKN